MSNPMSEQELERYFRQYLPPVALPEELATRLEARVLAEVAMTLHAPEGRREDGRPTDASWSATLRRWFDEPADRLGRLSRAGSFALAGGALVVLLMFSLLLPRMITPQGPSTTGAPGLEEVLQPAAAPAETTASATVTQGEIGVQRGSTDAVLRFPTGEQILLTAGDTLQTGAGQVEISFFNGQYALLEAETSVRIAELQDTGAATIVTLEQDAGTSRHRITEELEPGDRYEVRTPTASASAAGTEFSVTVRSSTETLIQTSSGSVAVQTATDSVSVESGQQARARTGRALVIETMPSARSAIEPTQRAQDANQDRTAATTTVAGIDVESAHSATTDSAADSAADSTAEAPNDAESAATASASSAAQVAQAAVATTEMAAGSDVDGTSPAQDGEPAATPAQGALIGTPTAAPASPVENPGSVTSGASPPATTAASVPTATPTGSATPGASPTPQSAATASATATTRPGAAAPTQTPTTSAIEPLPTPTLTPVAGSDEIAVPDGENSPPVVVADTATTAEEQALSIAVLANDYDADRDTLVVTGLGQPAHGRTVNNGNGAVTYTPEQDFFGDDTFTYRVSDGSSVRSGVVTVTVIPVNDPPLLAAIEDQALMEDGAATLILDVTDPDTALEALTVSVVSASAEGEPALFDDAALAPTLSETGYAIRLQPLENRSGVATIDVTVDDGEIQAVRRFAVTVAPVNDPPVIAPVADQVIAEDGVATLSVNVSDVEQEAASLTLTVESDDPALLPPDGLAIDGDGATRTLTVQPAADASGTAVITLTAADGTDATTRTFAVTVTPQDDAPTIAAVVDQTMAEDSTVELPLVLTDIDTPGATLIVEARAGDTALVPPDGLTLLGEGFARSLRIAPAPDRHGSTQIMLTVGDGTSQQQTDFMLTVTPVNDPPTIEAIADRVIDEDQRLEAPLVLADPDQTADALTLTIARDNTALIPADGMSVRGGGADRTLIITPAADQSGTAQITVTVSDGQRQAQTAFTLTVNPINDPPAIEAPDALSMDEETVGELAIAVSDEDDDPGGLQLAAASNNADLLPPGALQVGGSGSERILRIIPPPDRSGTAQVTIIVNDGRLESRHSARITVNDVNDPPTLAPLANLEMNEDEERAIKLTPGDVDDDLTSLQIAVESSNPALFGADGLRLSGSPDAPLLTLTPTQDQVGSAVITVTVSDGKSPTQQRFDVSVTPVNDPPSAVDDVVDFAAGPSVTIPVLDNDVDDDRSALHIMAVGAPSNGSVSIVGNALQYTPAATFAGADVFTYTVSDGEFSAAGQVSVIVE